MTVYRVGTSIYAVTVIGRQMSGGAVNTANAQFGPHQGNVGLFDQYEQIVVPFVVPVEEIPEGGDAEIGGTDAGVGIDVVAQSQTVTDTGSGADTAVIRISVTDTGSGSEAIGDRFGDGRFGDATFGPIDTGVIGIPLTDTGSGADATVSFAVTLTLTETAAGADTTTTGFSVADVAAAEGSYGGVDTYGFGSYGNRGQAVVIGVLASDSATGIDSSWLFDGSAVQVSVSDTGSGVDVVRQDHALSDSATGIDGGIIGLRVSEAHGEYGTGTYGSGTYATEPTVVESASGGDIVPITPTADTGTGVESASVGIAVPVTDSATGSDSASIAVAVPVSDTGAVLEATSSTAATSDTDLAAAVDALIHVILGGDDATALESENVTESAAVALYVLLHTSIIGVVPFVGSIDASVDTEMSFGDGWFGFGAFGHSRGVESESTSVLVPAFSGETSA
jgi:hypothetical protein